MTVRHGSENDLWAFREGKRNASGEALFRELATAVVGLENGPLQTRAMSALMRAGEFESGLADVGFEAQVPAQQLTDALADAFISGKQDLAKLQLLLGKISQHQLPAELSISPPEGFAYYALHPADFAEMASRVAERTEAALVVGIRSIGTTLSAIVRAALQQQGKHTERITARPTGHPYDRSTVLNSRQLQLITRWKARSADFLVVDEGPGRSGSSFLSVAEALTGANVPAHRINLLGSRKADANTLCARDAAARWGTFRFFWPEASVYKRFWDHVYVGGGDWRGVMLGETPDWPACWPQMERLKFLSPDRRYLYKFEGFGRFGEEVLARANAMAHAGFGLSAEDGGDGLLRYPVVQGKVLHGGEISRPLLEHMARYCAFRASDFRLQRAPMTQLPAMVGFNVHQELGLEVNSDLDQLCSGQPVLADGRMQPHEWLCAEDGSFVKVDAYTHGDDHFFPGPTDIAWDLAGTIVEWDLEESAAEFFLEHFRQVSGIDPRPHISAFILAYTVFRLAYCKMALPTVYGSPEEERMERAYRHYRTLVEQQTRARQFRASASRFSVGAPTQSGTAA